MPWVFGYGSLMNKASAENTFSVTRVVVGTLHGYKRLWGVLASTKNSVVMGVVSEKGRRCVGAFLELKESDFAALDLREKQYDRVLLQEDEYESREVLRGDVYVYVPRPETLQFPTETTVTPKYFSIVHEGAQALGIWDAFVEDTDGWEYLDEHARAVVKKNRFQKE